VPYPAKRLHEGEDVYLETRPHWSVLFLPGLETAVVLGGIGAGFVLWTSAPVWFGWILLAITIVALARMVFRVLAWRSSDLIVTSMRVIHDEGVLHRRGIEIPISSVQSVGYSQSLIARMLRRGDVEVESAGSGGAEIFADIPNPSGAQSLINHAIDKTHTRNVTQVAQAAATPNDSIADEIERLSKLHQRGIITDDEFDRLKRDLIAGGRSEG
jgi:uncharacterized membrane protein YdbT with pleckstrin-like domain